MVLPNPNPNPDPNPDPDPNPSFSPNPNQAIKVFKADPDYGYRVEEYAVEAAGRKPAIALPSWLSSKKMEVGKKASAASSSVRLRKSPASQPPPPPEDLVLRGYFNPNPDPDN